MPAAWIWRGTLKIWRWMVSPACGPWSILARRCTCRQKCKPRPLHHSSQRIQTMLIIFTLLIEQSELFNWNVCYSMNSKKAWHVTSFCFWRKIRDIWYCDFPVLILGVWLFIHIFLKQRQYSKQISFICSIHKLVFYMHYSQMGVPKIGVWLSIHMFKKTA